MDNPYTSSGFQLYGQPVQAATVQQGGQPINQAAQAQQLGSYTLIPTAAGTGQPQLTNLRNQQVQILQPAAPNNSLGAVNFQTQATQQSQQRLQTAPFQGLTSQQLQYLQAAQSGQLTAPGLQSFSQPPQQLGAIQILQPKTQPSSQGMGRNFNQTQVQSMQVLPQTPQQTLQPGQGLQQGLQSLQQYQSIQTIPGVQVLQQYPNYGSQLTPQANKTTNMGSGFQPPSHHHPSITGQPGAGGGHHTGSLFSNSNQRGPFHQGRTNWSERDRSDRTDFHGRNRDRMRRDDRGPFGSRMPGRDPLPRMAREREPFRHDRGRDRHDRSVREYPRRDKDFGKDRKMSPMHHTYDFKKEDIRKDPRRETSAKPTNIQAAKDMKLPLQQTPLTPKPPPVADYSVKVPQVPFVTYERDYSDIARRYIHLHVASDFTKLICHWAKISTEQRFPYGCCLCPLNKPVKFEMVQGPHEPDVEIVLPATKNTFDGPVRWNAKCTFMCGLDEKSHANILKGKFDGGTHLINALKFVVVREEKEKKKTGIMCLGGPYDPDIDGNVSETIEERLRKACIRHVKNQTLLDLTPCKTWIRFCDIHYSRQDDGKEIPEVTVIFIVDVTEIIPTAEEWPNVWKEQNEWKQRTVQLDIAQVAKAQTEALQQNGAPASEATEDIAIKGEGSTVETKDISEVKVEELPKDISVLMKCRSAKNGKVKTMNISLDGLLDYEETDTDEATFELSLMAESFNEMLMRDYGSLILNALNERKEMTDLSKDEKKRSSETSITSFHEPAIKKHKPLENEATSEDKQGEDIHTAAGDTEMQCQDSPGDVVHVSDLEVASESAPNIPEETPSNELLKEELEMDNDVEMKEAEIKKDPVINEELLFAFRYFDRAGCGYIKCDDLRRLLHNLGCCLPPRVVRELVQRDAVMNKGKPERVVYHDLVEMHVPL